MDSGLLQRCSLVQVLGVDVRTMGEKKPSYACLVPMSGGVERRGSPMGVLVAGIHFGPSFQEQARDFNLASPSRPVQRRRAVLVPSMYKRGSTFSSLRTAARSPLLAALKISRPA